MRNQFIVCLRVKFRYFVGMFVCLLYCSFSILAQNDKVSVNSSWRDIEQYYELNKNDISNKTLAVDVLLEKGKNEKNLLKITQAYYYKANFNNIDAEIEQLYYDSIISYSDRVSDKKYVVIALYERGKSYHVRKKYRLALDDYVRSAFYNTSDNSEHLSFLINKNMAQLKIQLDEKEEALELLKKSMEYCISINCDNTDKLTYLHLMFNLSEVYRRNSYLDSSRTYKRLGIIESRKLENTFFINYFNLLEGLISFDEGNASKAITEFEIVKSYLIKTDQIDNLSSLFYYLGEAYVKIGDNDEALKNFKNVDSIFDITNSILPEVTKAYNYLINRSSELNNIEEQLYYVNKLMLIDSIHDQEYRYLNSKIVKDYDIPELTKSKQKLIDNLENEKSNADLINVLFLILILVLIIIIIYQIRKRKIFRKRFNELNSLGFKEIDVPVIESSIIVKKSLLPDHIKNEIKCKLDDFEKLKQFVDSAVSLTSLSKDFETNSKYLSAYINSVKGVNFSNYIKSLRIEEAFIKLKEDKIFRQYTIKAISEEVGFRNTESFSKEFYKKYKIYPSFYIKQLKKLNI